MTWNSTIFQTTAMVGPALGGIHRRAGGARRLPMRSILSARAWRFLTFSLTAPLSGEGGQAAHHLGFARQRRALRLRHADAARPFLPRSFRRVARRRDGAAADFLQRNPPGRAEGLRSLARRAVARRGWHGAAHRASAAVEEGGQCHAPGRGGLWRGDASFSACRKYSGFRCSRSRSPACATTSAWSCARR